MNEIETIEERIRRNIRIEREITQRGAQKQQGGRESMDRGLNKAFEKLTEALQFTGDKNVVAIRACRATHDGGFIKEVAEITFRNGSKFYADIGGDSNTTAMYDVLAVLCGLKPRSHNIEKIEYIEEAKT